MYVGSEDAPTTFGAALHRDVDGHGQEVILLIGPEGDFTPEELGQIIDHGVQPVTMGARRLRTETAAIAMLSYAIVHTGT